MERSNEAAQFRDNVRADEEHWEAQQKQKEARQAVKVAYERDLMDQIESKQGSRQEKQDLYINKDYINNIKQIKDLLQEEIQLKESVVHVKNSGKKIINSKPVAI